MELEFSPYCMRYYNDMIWYYYSIVGIPVLFIIALYKLVCDIFSIPHQKGFHNTLLYPFVIKTS